MEFSEHFQKNDNQRFICWGIVANASAKFMKQILPKKKLKEFEIIALYE